MVFLTQVASGTYYQEYKYFCSLHLGLGITRETRSTQALGGTASLTRGRGGARRPLHRCWSPEAGGPFPAVAMRPGAPHSTGAAAAGPCPPPAWKRCGAGQGPMAHTVRPKKGTYCGPERGENIQAMSKVQSETLSFLVRRCS